MIAFGILFGVAVGAAAAFANYLLTLRGIRKGDVKAVSTASSMHMIVNIAALAIVFFLRNVLPFDFMYSIVSCAVVASSGTLLFTYLLVKKLDREKKAAERENRE